MSQSVDATASSALDAAPSENTALGTTTHPTDRPIPLWPEGVLMVAAGIVLIAVGLKHRVFLQRKYQELKRAADEFQRQGGLEDLAQVAKQAQELLKGK